MIQIKENLPAGEAEKSTALDLRTEILQHFLSEHVSTSLKYYTPGECFSEWNDKRLLKHFTKFIKMLRNLTPEQVRSQYGHFHTGGTHSKSGFIVPDNISTDVGFYSLRLDTTARLHGFFVGSVFFLVWLDRHHRYHS